MWLMLDWLPDGGGPAGAWGVCWWCWC